MAKSECKAVMCAFGVGYECRVRGIKWSSVKVVECECKPFAV